MVADLKNLTWLSPYNIHVSGYLRTLDEKKLYCLFNYSDETAYVTWAIFKQHGPSPEILYDHWNEKLFRVASDKEHLVMPPYTFNILEVK